MKLFTNWTIQKTFISIFVVYVLLVIIASIQSYLLVDSQYTLYNNYVIFKQSNIHLVKDLNLYIHYPQEHNDLFKYSPTFAFLFGTFTYLPDILGLSLWNLLNAIVFFLAIYLLPSIDKKKSLFFYFRPSN